MCPIGLRALQSALELRCSALCDKREQQVRIWGALSTDFVRVSAHNIMQRAHCTALYNAVAAQTRSARPKVPEEEHFERKTWTNSSEQD